MVRPTARVLALLEILQGGGTRTVADLADRLGVDPRTVRRYVDHLVDLEIPVESVRGRYGGYRLAPGYRLPPLMLTEDEALAVLLGLAARAPGDGAGEVDPRRAVAHVAAQSAAAKVGRVLPKALAARLAALLEVADLEPAGDPGAWPETGVLLLVAQAARDRRPLEVVHRRDGRTRERTVQPYGVVAHAGRWYLCGADSASGEVRTFRLDRLDAVRPGPGTFEPPPGVDPRRVVLEALARTPWRHRVVVRVHAEESDVQARLPPGLATVEPAEDAGWVRVGLRAERLDWVPGVLVALDAEVVVEEPVELAERLHRVGRRLLGA